MTFARDERHFATFCCCFFFKVCDFYFLDSFFLECYLNLTEEDFVPDAVAADDAAANLGAFSLGGKVEEPALQRAVGLAEDLQTRIFFFLN